MIRTGGKCCQMNGVGRGNRSGQAPLVPRPRESVRLWGSLLSCAPVFYRRSRRVANPPQVDNLPHIKRTCLNGHCPSQVRLPTSEVPEPALVRIRAGVESNEPTPNSPCEFASARQHGRQPISGSSCIGKELGLRIILYPTILLAPGFLNGVILLDPGRVAIPGRVRHMEVSSLSWIKTGEDSCKQPPR